jgi:hypothetical protein
LNRRKVSPRLEEKRVNRRLGTNPRLPPQRESIRRSRVSVILLTVTSQRNPSQWSKHMGSNPPGQKPAKTERQIPKIGKNRANSRQIAAPQRKSLDGRDQSGKWRFFLFQGKRKFFFENKEFLMYGKRTLRVSPIEHLSVGWPCDEGDSFCSQFL